MTEDFYKEAAAAFAKARATAEAALADPTNREKVKAAQEAAMAYKELHRNAAANVGLPIPSNFN